MSRSEQVVSGAIGILVITIYQATLEDMLLTRVFGTDRTLAHALAGNLAVYVISVGVAIALIWQIKRRARKRRMEANQ